MHKILTILIVVSLVGCTTSQPANSEKLAAEVNSKVKNGMLFTQAQTELGKRGFVCHEGTSIEPNRKGIYDCSRHRGEWLLYSCIHRVWFEAKSVDSVILNLEIHEPVCASL